VVAVGVGNAPDAAGRQIVIDVHDHRAGVVDDSLEVMRRLAVPVHIGVSVGFARAVDDLDQCVTFQKVYLPSFP
jgi:hypothetical protein